MYFDNKNKGKIEIHLEEVEGNLNSEIIRKGIAREHKNALTALLVNFVSLSLKNGKDPKELIDKHLDGILEMLSKK